jgi:hypothetical protein
MGAGFGKRPEGLLICPFSYEERDQTLDIDVGDIRPVAVALPPMNWWTLADGRRIDHVSRDSATV